MPPILSKASTNAPLADPAILAARQTAFAAPANAVLRRYAASIRAVHGPTPDFDPADGGVAATVLLLLETPGPAIWRTGFVSMDNASGTSANLRRFLAVAGLDRSALVIWNVVPWVIHTGGPNRAPASAELRTGLALIAGLRAVLPHLRCALLSGRLARQAEKLLPDLPCIAIPHPSPTYVCTSPDIAERITAGLRQAAAYASLSLGDCR